MTMKNKKKTPDRNINSWNHSNRSNVQQLIALGVVWLSNWTLILNLTNLLANICWLETWHIVLCSLGLSAFRYSLQSPDDVIFASSPPLFKPHRHTHICIHIHRLNQTLLKVCSSLVWSDCSKGLQDKLTSLCHDNPLFQPSQEAWTHFIQTNNHSITFTEWLTIETGYN